MMSSYSRISGDRLIFSKEKVSINDEYRVDQDVYYKDMIQRKIKKSEERIKEKEREAMIEIENNKQKIFNETYEKARKQGYEEGKKTALDEAEIIVRNEKEAIYNDLIEQAKEVYKRANDYYEELIRKETEIKEKFMEENKEEIVEIVFLMLKKIVNQSVEKDLINPLNVFELVKKEVQSQTKKVYIRIHPDTKKLVENEFNDQIDERMVFLVDIELQPLDFILETEMELIDLTIENQINNMKEYIRSVLNA